MAWLPGQKTFQQIYQEVSEVMIGGSGVVADEYTNPKLSRIKQMVNDEHRRLCALRDWPWMYQENTLQLVADQTDPYVLPDNVAEVYWLNVPVQRVNVIEGSIRGWAKLYPGRYVNLASGQVWMYVKGPLAANGAMQLFMYPASSTGVQATYGFKVRCIDMVDDEDVPLIPPEFQDVLVAKSKMAALMKAGTPESFARMKVYKEEEYMPLLNLMALKCDQAKEWVVAFETGNVNAGSVVGNDSVLWSLATGGW